MTDNFIKESISLNYVSLIAQNAGFTVEKPSQDFGTDLVLREQVYSVNNNKKHYYDSGRIIDVQVKSTTILKNIGNYWEYNLRLENYTACLKRLNTKTPYIFIIFKVPKTRKEWVTNDLSKLILKKCAYYYIPDGNENVYKTIAKLKIPKKNLLTGEVLKKNYKG